jgi:hypothetical protein
MNFTQAHLSLLHLGHLVALGTLIPYLVITELMRERLLSPFEKRSDYFYLYLYEWFSWNINIL